MVVARAGSRIAHVALVTMLASVALYGGACSSSDPAESPPVTEDLSDVVYVGTATDEGLIVLLGKAPVVRPESSPRVLVPADAETLQAPVTFEYAIGAETGRLEPGPARGKPSPWLELFGPERSAHAHGAPMNGAGFLLVFTSSSGERLLRVFTQETGYLPTAAEWARFVEAGAPVTFTVTLAIFDEGRLTRDGGPFVSPAVTFSAVE